MKGNTTVLWAILPVAVLLAAYAPRVISFAAGQAAFTVVIVVLSTSSAHGLAGRIAGSRMSRSASRSAWASAWCSARGAAALLRQNLAEAYSRSADYVAAMVSHSAAPTWPGGGSGAGRHRGHGRGAPAR